MIPSSTSDMSIAWLTEVLRASSAIRDATVVGARFEQVGVGVGLMGELHRATLTYDRAEADAPTSVVVKIASPFEANRAHLRAVAYRMLGSLSEADDAVQEAWLRLSRSGGTGVENLGRWLTTVVARVSLDMLRSRTSRREEPLAPHLPESCWLVTHWRIWTV